MEQAVQHYCQKLLQEALTRWKAHHQGCVRKRVRQRATPRAPQRGQAVWAGRPRSGEERSSPEALPASSVDGSGRGPAGTRLPFWLLSEDWGSGLGSLSPGWTVAQQGTRSV